MTSPASEASDVEPVVNWRACAHHFIFTFGPVKECRHCGATTIASVDGKSKPIYPPLDLNELEAS